MKEKSPTSRSMDMEVLRKPTLPKNISSGQKRRKIRAQVKAKGGSFSFLLKKDNRRCKNCFREIWEVPSVFSFADAWSANCASMWKSSKTILLLITFHHMRLRKSLPMT